MNAKHATGPWKAIGAFIENDDREEFATITSYDLMTPRQAANARLIAAAPELLAALQALLNYGNLGAYERADAVKAARAAIAKAVGAAA